MKFSREMIKQVNQNPLYQTMGIRIESVEEAVVKARLEPAPEMCWPFPGQPHGGVLFTLMDTTMAWAAISGQEAGSSCTTIHMDIQYTCPARGPSFCCVAEVTSRTKRISFIKATISDSIGVAVAMGQGTYRIIQGSIV